MARREMNANWERRRWLAGLGMIGLLMLFSHQNCAPSGNASGTTSTGTALNPGDSQPITITDSSTQTLVVSFAQPQIQLNVQSGETSVQGICSTQQEGSVLSWTIQPASAGGASGSDVRSGSATCTGGHFEVQLSNVEQLTCGEPYELTAQFGFVTPGQTVISYACGN
jgi:hypothetical protein